MQKQDESLKSLAKSENSELMRRFQCIIADSTKASSSLEAKEKLITAQYRENRSKLLQKSLRVAREHNQKASSLQARISAAHKRLHEMKKTSVHIRKQKMESLMRRIKNFKETQASEVSS